MYCIKPTESPQFPASAPTEMTHSATVRCTMNSFSVPMCFANSCRRDAGIEAVDSKVRNLESDSDSLSRG